MTITDEGLVELQRRYLDLMQERDALKAANVANMATATDWRQVALRVGEELASVGPDGYYGFTPDQWRSWALAAVDALRQQLAALADKGTLQALRDANDRAERWEAALCERMTERDEAREQVKTLGIVVADLRQQLAEANERWRNAVERGETFLAELAEARERAEQLTIECRRLSEALSASIKDYNRMRVAYQEAAKQAELNRLSCELKTEYLAKETAARSRAEQTAADSKAQNERLVAAVAEARERAEQAESDVRHLKTHSEAWLAAYGAIHEAWPECFPFTEAALTAIPRIVQEKAAALEAERAAHAADKRNDQQALEVVRGQLIIANTTQANLHDQLRTEQYEMSTLRQQLAEMVKAKNATITRMEEQLIKANTENGRLVRDAGELSDQLAEARLQKQGDCQTTVAGEGIVSDILQRLADVEEAKSGASFRHGCIECGLSAVLCADAANEIENLRRERDEAQALLRETQKRLDREEVAAFKATSERDTALALLRQIRENYPNGINADLLARIDAALEAK